MRRMRKLSVSLLVFALFTSASAAHAEETMQRVLRNSLYGGIVGALLGSAVLLLSDEPDENLGYIPTGAAVGILVGAAYGVATSGVVESASAAEFDPDGRITLAVPTISTEKIYDEKLNEVEEIEKIDLVRLKF